eukprot:CAMPEP_0182536312 /NCGR_PEP_ID=MMETSP1323-20130603/19766_1 /TAXON_ID=236787 /ORGANISM="Florenciella parvula, Strain RCC1693" /LENGTH=114 /DNA_ID=CAMNT_0024746535 /DNA_START=19 /DNA_END=359 /DNA_ORIENTATION=-
MVILCPQRAAPQIEAPLFSARSLSPAVRGCPPSCSDLSARSPREASTCEVTPLLSAPPCSVRGHPPREVARLTAHEAWPRRRFSSIQLDSTRSPTTHPRCALHHKPPHGTTRMT